MVFILALDKIVVSVHVVFNEIIPDPSAEYFSELERLKIEVALESWDPKDYQQTYAHQEIVPPADRAQGEKRSDASWLGHIYHTHTDMTCGS